MKKKKAMLIGLALSLTMVLFSAGCGSQNAAEATQAGETQSSEASGQTQNQDAAGSGVPQLSIEVISGGEMGEEWVSLFEQGVQEQLDRLGNGSLMNAAGIMDIAPASELIDQGLDGSCDGIILAADADREDAGEAIERAAQKGVPVLTFRDNMSNGYNMAAPDAMGRSMTEALISRIALFKGPEAWGDQTDFGKQLCRAVQGLWGTFSSAGDRKQFIDPYVMEFSQNSEGLNELRRVSLIEEIKNTPDGKGYSYVLNTGNSYYLLPESPGLLECHWEPDGYSASDSLMKEPDDTGDSAAGNSVFVLDMDSYSGSEEYFQGTITTFDGYGAMGNGPEECIALNLATPVRVFQSGGRDVLISAIQLNTESSLSEYINKGTVVKATGRLFEAETDHHFTPVIMNVSTIE